MKWLIVIWTLLLLSAVTCLWVAHPTWLAGEESASTTLRNLGFLVAAAVGLPLAIWRAVVAERQADAARQQSEIAVQHLMYERFQSAAEMLGNTKSISMRLGGIHALAHLARNNPEEFHLPVMRLFAAFLVDRKNPETVERPELEKGLRAAEDVETHTGTPSTARLDDSFFCTADQEVGLVPEPTKDVEEVVRSISDRSETQMALERKEGFRMNLAGVFLAGIIFHDADFSGFDFTKADLRRVRGWRARLRDASLPGADLSGANLHGAELRKANMRRVNLTAARLTGADLREADLGLVDVVSQNLWKGTLFPSRLVAARLPGADLRGAGLGRADMRGASLEAARLDNTNLADANLSGSDLRAASLKGAALRGADLSGANLGGAGADLSGADLHCANLTGANLGSAKLAGANLADATVSGANFAEDWRTQLRSPASGLTQEQLDQAIADPSHPPILDGVLDAVTDAPLVWRGASSCQNSVIE